MKSPLVEALRQAKGKTDATGDLASDPADAETPSRGPDSIGKPVQDSAETEFGESLEILPIDGRPESAAGDDGADFDGSLSLQGANDDESDSGSAEESSMIEAAAAPAQAATRPSRAPRIATYAPLICIGAALASGMSHFAYQWFGGRHENADLAVISAKDSESPGIPAHDSLLAPPTRFKLAVDQAAARTDDHGEERLQAGLSEPGSKLP